MAPRRALNEILGNPVHAHERFFLLVLALMLLVGVLATVGTWTLIVIDDRRIARNQQEIIGLSRQVILNTERLRLLDQEHYTNLLQFKALTARLDAVRATLKTGKPVNGKGKRAVVK